MKLTGAEILIQALQAENVEYVFGYPGGSVLHIYDALFKQKKIKHVLVRHEQAAAHAADAYSRSSNKIGVAMVTSGPGLTNTVTGIATAYMDSVPMVVISGQVNTDCIGQDAFQECDAVGITRPCVKHNFLVKDVKDLAITIKKAFYIAKTGRPGPVVIDIPKDVTAQVVEFDYPETIAMRSYNPITRGHAGQIKKAVQLLKRAKQPVLYMGGGVVLANASAPLKKFVDAFNLPVVSTLMGLGGFPGNDKHFLGMVGMHGTYEANNTMHYADVVLAVGARFDDRVIGNVPHFQEMRDRHVIHIDIDPSSIAKRVKTDLPIVGHIFDVLSEMAGLVEKDANFTPPDLTQWWQQINIWRQRNSLAYPMANEIMPQFVIQKLYEITKGKAIVCSDVGQHQMFCAQYYKFDEPRRWINSGGLGTMGVGLPYAMGASFANPKDTVVCVTGEGSIQMNIQELSTCKQFGLPIKIINLNNGMLGMVRQWQEMFYSKRYSQTYMTSLPSFQDLARAYGHVGMRIDKIEDVEPALKTAFTKHKNDLVFMDFVITPEANVLPMVAAGKGLTEMILADHPLSKAEAREAARELEEES